MSGSSSSGNGGEWYPGKYCRLGWTDGQATRVHARDDNLLLKLDKGALRVLNSKLTFMGSWHLRWAIEKAVYAKKVMNNRPSRVSKQETVDGAQSL